MAHFQVVFDDKYYMVYINQFDTFTEAQKYWDDHADAEIYVAGEMINLDTGEIIWEFDRR